MTQAIVQLSALLGDGGLAPLQAAARARSQLRIDCGAAARLPAGLIGAALGAAADGARLQLDGLAAHALRAVEIIDRAGTLALGERARAGGAPCEQPFSVAIHGDQLELRVAARGRGAAMASPLSHEWLRGVSCARLVVDLGAIEHLDSALVAWLLQLSQSAAPAKVALRQVSAQAATQLRQLRLNHIMELA